MWLDPDREVAGQMYKTIHAGLVRIFVSKGLSGGECLADEVMDRVAKRQPEVGPTYKDRANYCRGIARKLILEARRGREIATDKLPERPFKVPDFSDEYECLLKCLDFFPRQKREMILDYHVYEGEDKISTHRSMAEELRISENALRVKAHRARVSLEQCVRECVESLKAKRNSS
jgi:DNA-directed RNA polymerase specialized sigma24 family protein